MIHIKTFLGLTYYTSELDKFLAEFNSQHKQSESQRQEQEKYARIYQLRDKDIFTTQK
jgi:hypothetical protein